MNRFQANHLVGLKRTFLKLSFLTVEDLTSVKREIFPAIRKNKEREKSKDLYTEMLTRYIKNFGWFVNHCFYIIVHWETIFVAVTWPEMRQVRRASLLTRWTTLLTFVNTMCLTTFAFPSTSRSSLATGTPFEVTAIFHRKSNRLTSLIDL